MLEPLLRLLWVQLVRVRGDSMAQALRDGQWVLVDRRAYRRRPPARFDIVRFEDPSRPGAWSVKRIVGLPGEQIALRDGQLTINGQPVREPHVDASIADAETHEWRPGPRQYVVLGDNRLRSTDSRRYGPVPLSAIRGRVLAGRTRQKG